MWKIAVFYRKISNHTTASVFTRWLQSCHFVTTLLRVLTHRTIKPTFLYGYCCFWDEKSNRLSSTEKNNSYHCPNKKNGLQDRSGAVPQQIIQAPEGVCSSQHLVACRCALCSPSSRASRHFMGSAPFGYVAGHISTTFVRNSYTLLR